MGNVKFKGLLIIVDGLNDLPSPDLGGRTPLESAFTPNLDRFASAGVYGQIEKLPPGNNANTWSSCSLLMGLAAEDEARLKLGPLEAAGAELELQAGDVALRVNFASMNPAFNGFVVTDRRAGHIDGSPELLATELDQMDLGDDVRVTFRSTGQHRGVMVLSGADLNDAVSDTDPGGDELPAPVLSCRPLIPEARKTADKINAMIKLSHSRLMVHPTNQTRAATGKSPANGIITRGAGSPFAVRNVIHGTGLSAAVISGSNSVRGLGRLFNFTVIAEPGFSVTSKFGLVAIIRAGVTALQNHDLALVHIQAPDSGAVDRKPMAKKDFIEQFDAALAPIADRRMVTAITAGLGTATRAGQPFAGALPAVVYSPSHEARLLGVNFGEEACRKGIIACQTRGDFLQHLLAEMGMA